MDRRAFARLTVCAATAALQSARSGSATPPSASYLTRYSQVLLTTASGDPLRVGGLDPEEEYLFFYPFTSSPCLLLDLGRPIPATEVPVRGRSGYRWGGGIGPQRSVVAFTAICPHEWAHPERALSAIGYHRTGQQAAVVGGRDRLIVCCAHGSAFDPEAGGRVEQSPAELPLATVVLSWEPQENRVFADGLLGIATFERFFAAFSGKSRAFVRDQTPVVRLREYSAAVARC